jgi:hypothetical protein
MTYFATLRQAAVRQADAQCLFASLAPDSKQPVTGLKNNCLRSIAFVLGKKRRIQAGWKNDYLLKIPAN